MQIYLFAFINDAIKLTYEAGITILMINFMNLIRLSVVFYSANIIMIKTLSKV